MSLNKHPTVPDLKHPTCRFIFFVIVWCSSKVDAVSSWMPWWCPRVSVCILNTPAACAAGNAPPEERNAKASAKNRSKGLGLSDCALIICTDFMSLNMKVYRMEKNTWYIKYINRLLKGLSPVWCTEWKDMERLYWKGWYSICVWRVTGPTLYTVYIYHIVFFIATKDRYIKHKFSCDMCRKCAPRRKKCQSQREKQKQRTGFERCADFMSLNMKVYRMEKNTWYINRRPLGCSESGLFYITIYSIYINRYIYIYIYVQ